MKKLWKHKNISLKIKTIGCVIFGAFVLSCVATWISYDVYSKTMDEHYRNMTMNLAKTEATMLDKGLTKALTEKVLEIYRENCGEIGEAPAFDDFSEKQWTDYYAKYDEVINSVEFQGVLKQIHGMAQVNDVMSMYICYMDELTNKAIYIVDGTLTADICNPGTCDDIEDGNRMLMEQGIYDFPAYITNYEEYGWLCSASAGIYDEDGTLIANAYVDISMDDVMMERQAFLSKLGSVLVIITVILVVLLVYALHYAVVFPINSLAYATSSFVSEKEKQGSSVDESAITKLQIHTGDEIEKLAEAIKKMECEINTYIENLTAITAEKERIGAELNVATQIQADMLPNIFPAFPEYSEFDIYATMVPAKEVGGDFYDLFMVDESHLAIVMADVSGKGVPAALFMVIAKTLIKNNALNKETPSQIFTNVNNQLCENNEVGMFVTGWLGIMDIFTGHMDYVNAGHNYPIIIRKDGSVEWVKSRPGLVLAGMEGIQYRQNELQLEEGDTIYLYTDGVTEALDISQELFGDKRLINMLSMQDVKEMKPEQLLEKVAQELKVFTGQAEQADDITMLALYRNIKEKEMEILQKILIVKAQREEWVNVSDFLEMQLKKCSCSFGIQTQILIAMEEVFVNIVSYAYEDNDGEVEIKTELSLDNYFNIEFWDSGIPYNPLERENPDITLSAEERNVGGLGIFIAKEIMDDVRYVYKDGKNCFMLSKKW